jgi:hypothetical protein
MNEMENGQFCLSFILNVVLRILHKSLQFKLLEFSSLSLHFQRHYTSPVRTYQTHAADIRVLFMAIRRLEVSTMMFITSSCDKHAGGISRVDLSDHLDSGCTLWTMRDLWEPPLQCGCDGRDLHEYIVAGVYTSENTKWKHKYMGILLLETSYVVHVGFGRFLA